MWLATWWQAAAYLLHSWRRAELGEEALIWLLLLWEYSDHILFIFSLQYKHHLVYIVKLFLWFFKLSPVFDFSFFMCIQHFGLRVNFFQIRFCPINKSVLLFNHFNYPVIIYPFIPRVFRRLWSQGLCHTCCGFNCGLSVMGRVLFKDEASLRSLLAGTKGSLMVCVEALFKQLSLYWEGVYITADDWLRSHQEERPERVADRRGEGHYNEFLKSLRWRL